MSNGNSGRSKLVKLLTTIIVLVITAILKIIVPDESNQSNVPTETNTQIQAEGQLEVHMIDVGQADSFLLVQDDKTALVDCGTRSTGKDVVEYLNSLEITKLDYVFGTHPHDDHMGGMYEVITNFEIGEIIIPEVEDGKVTSNWYMKLMKELNTGNYKVTFAKLEDIYNLNDAVMEIIGPVSKPDGSNINNYSTVLKVSFGEMDMIMTGDAETEIEKEIIESGKDIDAEILKVGHHGSDTSTSDEFLDEISPEYALISTKVGNKYEHPIKSTMEKLEEREIEIYRTDENGTVIVTIESDKVSFNCEPGDYLSGVELEERNK